MNGVQSSLYAHASNHHTARAGSDVRTGGAAAYFPPAGFLRGSTYQPGPA